MTDTSPFPPPNQHTDAIRDLQERFQLLERNLSQRLYEVMIRVDKLIREGEDLIHKYKDTDAPNDPDRYDYSTGDYET